MQFRFSCNADQWWATKVTNGQSAKCPGNVVGSLQVSAYGYTRRGIQVYNHYGYPETCSTAGHLQRA